MRLPPDLLERFQQQVPPGERAQFIRQLLEVALDAIVRDPERCGGKPTLAGTRTGVHDVVSYAHLYGGDLERVREEALPHLNMAQIRAAMDWYGEHREEIDEILRRRRERYERGLAEANAAR
jgi:uncharacterized protein (DUF433 family)